MYFLFSELHGRGKRLAARPQTIDSEVPRENPRNRFRGLIQLIRTFKNRLST